MCLESQSSTSTLDAFSRGLSILLLSTIIKQANVPSQIVVACIKFGQKLIVGAEDARLISAGCQLMVEVLNRKSNPEDGATEVTAVLKVLSNEKTLSCVTTLFFFEEGAANNESSGEKEEEGTTIQRLEGSEFGIQTQGLFDSEVLLLSKVVSLKNSPSTTKLLSPTAPSQINAILNSLIEFNIWEQLVEKQLSICTHLSPPGICAILELAYSIIEVKGTSPKSLATLFNPRSMKSLSLLLGALHLLPL